MKFELTEKDIKKASIYKTKSGETLFAAFMRFLQDEYTDSVSLPRLANIDPEHIDELIKSGTPETVRRIENLFFVIGQEAKRPTQTEDDMDVMYLPITRIHKVLDISSHQFNGLRSTLAKKCRKFGIGEYFAITDHIIFGPEEDQNRIFVSEHTWNTLFAWSRKLSTDDEFRKRLKHLNGKYL
jgi:hypothetical protein